MQSLDVLRRSPTADYSATVIHSVSLTPTIKAIRLRLDRDDFSFLPGQSVWPKFERDGRKFSKIYSIASSPSHCPEVELCVSRVGWSSAFLQDLAIGQSLPLRGPYGLMTLSELPQRPRLYIAEGSGIAPLKSQIDWLHECGYRQPVWLVQANPETTDQLPYQQHWQRLQQSWKAFEYREAIAQCPEAIVSGLRLNLADFEIVICAVGDRSDQLQEFMLSLGARNDQLRSEKFIAF
ncbi:MAG: FAD-dependent oxidoreductase [Tildeniella nuda ZEHNDER 1965/U140]|jgi:ferredoxin-NADP reductase|nr:FAD-dependent oxidoreductase [Tildeniella nuda ZEHNDER 1965/U140]